MPGLFWNGDLSERVNSTNNNNLNPNEKKIEGDEFEHILFVFAEKHESEDCAVNGKPEESLASGTTRKSMISGFDRLSESHRKMRVLLKIVTNFSYRIFFV